MAYVIGAVTASTVVTVAGCASAPTPIGMEPRGAGSRIGFSECRISVPLTQGEVIADARRLGNPNPSENPEWIQITKTIQSGDKLRAVNCLGTSRSTYFYALIRNDSVILEFYSSMFD
jgi:hypothetical protein